MKTKTILPVFLALFALSGCTGGNANPKQAGSKTVHSKEVSNSPELEEGEESGIGGNYNDDNPFTTLMAEYTPQQIRQLIGKTTPENVRDLFVLLPDDAFFELTPHEGNNSWRTTNISPKTIRCNTSWTKQPPGELHPPHRLL